MTVLTCMYVHHMVYGIYSIFSHIKTCCFESSNCNIFYILNLKTFKIYVNTCNKLIESLSSSSAFIHTCIVFVSF